MKRPEDGIVPFAAVLALMRDADRAMSTFIDFTQGGITNEIEMEIEPADGSPHRVIHSVAEAIWDGSGHIVKVMGVVHDITEQKRSAEHLKRLNRELLAIKECKSALINARSEHAYLNDVCRIISEKTEYCLAWIGMAEKDAERSVTVAAFAGNDQEYVRNVRVTWRDDERGRGPTGTAIRTGRTVLIKDWATEPCMAPWRQQGIKNGYRSSISVPLTSSETVIGALTVYSSEVDGFTPDEISLLEELASDLSYGITNFRGQDEKRAAEEAAQRDHARFENLFHANLEGVALHELVVDADGKPVDYVILDVNPAFEQMTDIAREDAVGRYATDVYHTPEAPFLSTYASVARGGRPYFFETYFPPMRKYFHISVFGTGQRQFATVFMDITERKMIEMERETTIEFLRIADEHRDTRSLVHAVIRYFQRVSGCSAVGIRLSQGPDFPYYESRGFPEDFLYTEMHLCAYDESGDVFRDKNGNPVIECMCGNVIMGRFDPTKEFFTGNGSFWSNSTTELLASTSDTDRQARTRNRCNGEGYESVALIPLRVGEERLGLLQLNDRSKGRFTPELIAYWERLAGYLAAELAQLRANEMMRSAEARYQMLFENSFDALLLTRPDGRILSANPAACRLFGMPEKMLQELGRDRVVVSDDLLAKALEERNRTGQMRAELTMRRGDGTIFIGEISSFVFTDVDGTEKTSVAIRDVTERRRAQAELETDRRKLIAGMELAKLVFWEFDGVANKFHFDDKFFTLYATCSDNEDPEMDLETYFHEFVHPEDLEHVLKQVKTNLDPKNPIDHANYEHRILRRDGSVRTISVRSILVRDAHGYVTKVYGVNQDITERKHTEEALREANRKLNLLSSITRHDILNQMMKMNATLDMMGEAVTDPAGVRLLHKANDYGKRITAMMEFTKTYEEIGVKSPTWQNLHGLVHKAAVASNAKDVIVVNDIPESSEVLADPLIVKVFFNLIENAVIYGEKLTNIRFTLEPALTGMRIVCADDGVGIPEDVKPYLFSRGFGRGHGLGLFLSKEILSITGMTISEMGMPGEGARFVIEVPKNVFRSAPRKK